MRAHARPDGPVRHQARHRDPRPGGARPGRHRRHQLDSCSCTATRSPTSPPSSQDLDFVDSAQPRAPRAGDVRGRRQLRAALSSATSPGCSTTRELFEQAGLDPDEHTPRLRRDPGGGPGGAAALDGDVHGCSFAGNCLRAASASPCCRNVWATGTDLFEGEIGEQTATSSATTRYRRMLELYRELWADDLVPRGEPHRDGRHLGPGLPARHDRDLPVLVRRHRPQRGRRRSCRKIGVTHAVRSRRRLQPVLRRGQLRHPARCRRTPPAAWAFIRSPPTWTSSPSCRRVASTPPSGPTRSTTEYRAEFPLDVVALENLEKAYAPHDARLQQRPSTRWTARGSRCSSRRSTTGTSTTPSSWARTAFSRLLEQAQL